jgi:hypothetical protein
MTLNTSATGGFLSPTTINGELNDQGIHRFLQQIVVGVTGMLGASVRPRWQPEPVNIPDFGIDWAAIGIVSRTRDAFAAVIHMKDVSGTYDGIDVVYRNQILEIMCSFYGPDAEANSELFAMGMQVAQNRETLLAAGYGLISVDDAVTTSDLLHDRWVPRIDVTFRVRRSQKYVYPVFNLLGAQATITDDTGAVVDPVPVNINLILAPVFTWGLNTQFFQGWGSGNWK